MLNLSIKPISRLANVVLKYLRLNLLLWVPAYGLAAVITITTKNFTSNVSFGSASLASITGDMLGFLGIVTAILIAVFVSIHVRARDATESGFRSLREAIEGLDRLGDEMMLKIQRGSPEHHDYLKEWSYTTKHIVIRLNEIRPTWPGWRSDQKLESYLSQVATVPTLVAAKTGTFLLNDLYWKGAVTEYDHRMRDVLIGLYTMNEGVVGNKLVNALSDIFSLLVVVLLFGLGLRLMAGVGLGSPAPDLLNLYWVLSLVGASAILLIMLVVAVDKWRTGLREQEEHWS